MVLWGKLAVSVVLLVVLLTSFKFNLSRIKNQHFTLFSWLALFLLRFVVFFAFFFVLNFVPQSDNVGYYSEAKGALAGGLIYRDFESSYGPLFTYMDAFAVYLWDSPKSIVFLSILVELAFFPLWLRIARLSVGEKTARLASLLYILSPIPLFVIAVNGQNQSFGAAYLALVVYLLIRGRDGWAGFVAGLSIPGVKFLMGLFVPVAGAFSKDRVKFITAFLLPILLFYGVLLFVGADLTVPLQIQGNDQTSGNLPFLTGLLGLNAASAMTRRVFDLFTLASLAIVFLIHVYRRHNPKPEWVIYLCTLIGLTFMLASKKSYSNYLVLFYFPFCISVASTGLSVGLFGVFNLLATLEPSLYFRWILASSNTGVPSLAFISEVHRRPFYVTAAFLVVDLCLIGLYVLYFVKTWRLAAGKGSTSNQSSTDQVTNLA
jgi:hypothetical protein